MSDHEPTVSPGVIMESVKLKPATDWIRLAFDTFLATVVIAALVATRGHDAPPAPAPPPAPPVQPAPAPVVPPRPVDPPAPVVTPEPVAADEADGGDSDIQAPASPLAAAAAQFHRTRPKALADLAEKVKSGEVGDVTAAVDFLRGHQKPFADALDAAFAAASDDQGKIVQPKALANQLRQAAAAMGAK
jgi:hypothetical protein